MTTNLVFDIGGTKTRIAKVVGGELVEVEKFKTPPSSAEGMTQILLAARRLVGESVIERVCGGFAGTVDQGVVYRAPSLPGWNGFALAERLQHEWSASVTVMNDTELVGLGEYFYGAGKGERDMFYITVSTGVGGAHVLNRHIHKGKYNLELGHQRVSAGELEALISGTAVKKKYGVEPQHLEDVAVRNELADHLAEGLFNTVTHWFPEAIVLGGSMMIGTNPIPIDRVAETLDTLVRKHYPSVPRLHLAKLGDSGGLHGGVAVLENF